MYGITTIKKLNDQAAEAARIVSAHSPAAKPVGTTAASAAARQHLANARGNIECILARRRG